MYIEAGQVVPGTVTSSVTALTNLAHLDWLCTPVPLRQIPGHTTYRLEHEPNAVAPWTYAECTADGSYRRIGGGTYDESTGWYSQGAYNADDVARAAVVYLRHWLATGEVSSRRSAYQVLRALAYQQTIAGPRAGNMVLWMQADGSLTPSADPPEQPDPSDNGESYWLARTVWAFGEGYAAFRDADPEFASFLRSRLRIALGAIERQTLARYGQWRRVDDGAMPAWLIANGADATGEALIGLAAYLDSNRGATSDPFARQVLDRLAEGVSAMGAGSASRWPFGAILPHSEARWTWHGWGGLAPAGLAHAFRINGSHPAREAARTDAASFTPHLLVAGGADNAWMPAPVDVVQIAYGAQSRVESLLAVAAYTDRPGLAALAGVAASWFFGNNPAGQPVYEPSTGRTFDGVDVLAFGEPGVVHRDSGAESTIHGLLAMLALDANPAVAAIARIAAVQSRHTWTLLEAENGRCAGDAERYDPVPGDVHSWSGGAGVRLGTGGAVTFDLPAAAAAGPSLFIPVVERCPGGGVTRWAAGEAAVLVEQASHEDTDPATLIAAATFRSGTPTTELTATGVRGENKVDAVLVQPEVEWVTLAQPGTGHGVALVRNFADEPRELTLAVPGSGPVLVTQHDQMGAIAGQDQDRNGGAEVRIEVPAGGFTLALRELR
jgi:hypothetical protein